jgi:hypothetical protein
MRVVPAILGAMLWAFAALPSADEARPVYVEVSQLQANEYLVKWKIPPVMAEGREPAVELRYSDCNFATDISGEARGRPAGLIGRSLYRCDTDLVALGNTLSVELIYRYGNPALSSLVVFKPLTGDVAQLFSGPEQTSIEIPLSTSASAVAKQYTVAGIEHILAGTDHLLFVLCLIMIAGTFKRLLLTVTGFTLAHSITLSLATLDIFRLPTELVELLIALSILLLAVEIIKHQRHGAKDSFTWRYPVSVSTVFGLLHGFGFAVVLQELGLPTAMKLPALLFFNIGVELGQLGFIAAILVLVMVAKKQIALVATHQATLAQWVVYAMGVCSAYWLLERSALLFS